jgi:hypothetical protein
LAASRYIFVILSAASAVGFICGSVLVVRSYWTLEEIRFAWHGQLCRIALVRGALLMDNKPQLHSDSDRQFAWFSRGDSISHDLEKLLRRSDRTANDDDVATLKSEWAKNFNNAPPKHLPWCRSLIAFVPLGLVAFSVLPVSVLFRYHCYRRDCRRRSKRLCVHCGYDLRATSERCPECGHGVDGL